MAAPLTSVAANMVTVARPTNSEARAARQDLAGAVVVAAGAEEILLFHLKER